MIYITNVELSIYNAYNKYQNVSKTAIVSKTKKESVSRALHNFSNVGLMEKKENLYVPTGAEFEIITLKEKTSGVLPKPKVEVKMTDTEKRWMQNHYKPRKRGEAAKALGRTRSDICLMAIALGVDVDGRWNNHAKSNKSCSA